MSYVPNADDTSEPTGGRFVSTAPEEFISIKEKFDRTIVAPDGETFSTLVSAAARANKLLGFDALGDLAVTVPDSQSAAALALALASPGVGNGADLVKYDASAAYASSTLGGLLNYTFGKTSAETALGLTPNYQYFQGDPRRYGAVFDGVTDDTDALLTQFNVIRQQGGGYVEWPCGKTALIRHGFNLGISNLTFNQNGCHVRATTTFSQGVIPAHGAIHLFEISHETPFGADPDISNIRMFGGGATLDLRRDEQTGTIPGYSGIVLETSDAPVQADLWKINKILVRDYIIERSGFDGWYVSGVSDWEFINVKSLYALRVGSVVIASRRGQVTGCACGYSVGPNPGLPANMQGPANSGDGWWNEPNFSWQDIDVDYVGCVSYFNYQSGFKLYNAGADVEVRILATACYAYQDAWDEVTQTRRSAAAESGFRNSMNPAGTKKFYIEYSGCVADRFERSGFQLQRGAAAGTDQVVVYNSCIARDCTLSNTNGNNRAAFSFPAGAGKTKIMLKSCTVIAPAANTLGYGISIDGGENIFIENDSYIGTFSERRNILGTGFFTGIRTLVNANETVAESDESLICNRAGTITLTLPNVLSWSGRRLKVRTITANAVVSASSNVVPLAGGAASTAILAATAGRWCVLESDGTSWLIAQAN